MFNVLGIRGLRQDRWTSTLFEGVGRADAGVGLRMHKPRLLVGRTWRVFQLPSGNVLLARDGLIGAGAHGGRRTGLGGDWRLGAGLRHDRRACG